MVTEHADSKSADSDIPTPAAPWADAPGFPLLLWRSPPQVVDGKQVMTESAPPRWLPIDWDWGATDIIPAEPTPAAVRQWLKQHIQALENIELCQRQDRFPDPGSGYVQNAYRLVRALEERGVPGLPDEPHGEFPAHAAAVELRKIDHALERRCSSGAAEQPRLPAGEGTQTPVEKWDADSESQGRPSMTANEMIDQDRGSPDRHDLSIAARKIAEAVAEAKKDAESHTRDFADVGRVLDGMRRFGYVLSRVPGWWAELERRAALAPAPRVEGSGAPTSNLARCRRQAEAAQADGTAPDRLEAERLHAQGCHYLFHGSRSISPTADPVDRDDSEGFCAVFERFGVGELDEIRDAADSLVAWAQQEARRDRHSTQHREGEDPSNSPSTTIGRLLELVVALDEWNRKLANDPHQEVRHYFRLEDERWATKRTWSEELNSLRELSPDLPRSQTEAVRVGPYQEVMRFLAELNDAVSALPDSPMALRIRAVFNRILAQPFYDVKNMPKVDDLLPPVFQDCVLVGDFAPIESGLIAQLIAEIRAATDSPVDSTTRKSIADAESDSKSTGKRKRMPKDEANRLAMEIAKMDSEFARKPTVREWAEKIGCSEGLVVNLPFYRSCAEKAGTARRGKPKKPKVVSLTDRVEANAGEGEQDSVLDQLIAEQESDYEPSPLEPDPPDHPFEVRQRKEL